MRKSWLLFKSLFCLSPLVIGFAQLAPLDNKSGIHLSNLYYPKNTTPDAAVIRIDPNITYQRMVGWEATDYLADWPGHAKSYPKYVTNLLDLAVNDLGINRIRLQIHSGDENSVDYAGQFLNGQITEKEYLHNPGYAYTTVNDNEDSFIINPEGFHFTWLDWRIESVVLPMKQLVGVNGEQLYINLCVVDFLNKNKLHSNNPEEYAEFILAIFQHMQEKYGFTPDGLEIQLEPNNKWDPTKLGKALVAAGKRLQENGFNPQITAPSNPDMTQAANWIDAMIQNPEVLNFLTELSYHRYGKENEESLERIRNDAETYGLKTAMLEHIGADYNELVSDLTLGAVSSWAQYTLLGKKDNGGQYFILDESDINNPKIYYGSRTKFLRQYFKFIRNGAVRIGADSNDDRFTPVAFTNKNGGFVVVVKADSGGQIAINGLPAGTYGVNYMTQEEFGKQQSDISIQDGETLRIEIPDVGVITVYSKGVSLISVTPTAISVKPPTSSLPLVVTTELPGVTLLSPTSQVTSPSDIKTPVDLARPGCSGSIPNR